MDRFPACLAETLRWEGGWSNDPYDPGGATMHGVIQKEYDAYRDRKDLPRRTVRQIERAEELEIYRPNYWIPARCDEMPVGVDMLVWDYSVNSGCGQAIKSLQRVLGLSIDGHLGSLTMDAVAQAAPLQLIRAYMDERRRFLRSLKTYWRFGKGWEARCDGVEAAALAAVTKSPPIFHAVGELPRPLADADAQSAQIGKAPAESPAPPMAAQASAAGGGILSLTQAGPAIMAKATQSGRLTFSSLAIAILTEPMAWIGMAALFGAIMFWLHRKRVNA